MYNINLCSVSFHLNGTLQSRITVTPPLDHLSFKSGFSVNTHSTASLTQAACFISFLLSWRWFAAKRAASRGTEVWIQEILKVPSRGGAEAQRAAANAAANIHVVCRIISGDCAASAIKSALAGHQQHLAGQSRTKGTVYFKCYSWATGTMICCCIVVIFTLCW